MKDKTILHIFSDNVFFDGVSDFYDRVEGIRNLYYFYSPNGNPSFKHIKNTGKIRIVSNLFDYLRLFSNKDVDIVLFHSINKSQVFLFPFIDSKKIVIWWAWGYDIYGDGVYIKALVKNKILKPKTEHYVERERNGRSKWYINIPLRVVYEFFRDRMISRIDYFMPCMPIDYYLMKESCRKFRAKISPCGIAGTPFEFEFKTVPQNILVGNSLTYSNNHLDVFEYLYPLEIANSRTIIVPVNYGNAFGSVDNLKNLSNFPHPNQVMWLDKMLSRDDYFRLCNSVTHAVFGAIRQQALGNIFYCLSAGVKLFLFKDSFLAKQLKEDGYIFFSIEDDLTTDALSKCLDRDSAETNYQIYKDSFKNSSAEVISDFFSHIEIRK